MTESKALVPRLAGPAVFSLLLAPVLFVFADQALLGPFLSPLLHDFFGSADDVVPLGWIGFAATAACAAAMVLAGVRADRRPRLRIVRTGALICGAASALSLLVPAGRPGYPVFFLARVAAGAGAGMVVPAVFSLAADIVPAARRATAFGYLSVSMLVGRLGGFGLAGLFAGGWRSAYAVLGGLEILAAAALLAAAEPVRGSQEEELRGAIGQGAEYRFRISWKDVKLIRSARSNVWLILNFVDAVPGAVVLFLIFTYMKDVHNLDMAAVNALLLIVFLAGAAGAMLFGRIGDWGFRRDKRAKVWTAMACNVAPIAFMLVFLGSRVRVADGASLGTALSTPGTAVLFLAVAAALFVNQGVNPNWYGTLTDINLPEHRGTMISLASVMDMAGNALGPLLGSIIATRSGLRTAMASVLAFWILNIVFWIPVLKHVRGDLARTHAVLAERARTMERDRKKRP